MLTSTKLTYGNELSFMDARVGDRFFWVTLRRITLRPIAVEAYVVLRVGKRDIVVTPVDGCGEKRISRYSPLPNAYLTDAEVVWAKDAIQSVKKDSTGDTVFSE